MSIAAIPLIAAPQQISVKLNGVSYQLTIQYRNTPLGGWTIDIADVAGNAILQGIPMVTGTDLLGQYEYLGLNASLYVQTTSDPDAVPTFTNLGGDAQLYVVTNP